MSGGTGARRAHRGTRVWKLSLHYRPPRTGRNPKTGSAVQVPDKFVPHFKPGKELRERVNNGAD